LNGRIDGGTQKGEQSMIDLIKKTIMAGLGAVVLTTEKVHEVTKRFVVEGKLSTEEAEKLADELVQSGEERWEEMSGKVSEGIRKGMETIDLVRMKEFEELKARVEKLEAQMAGAQPESKPEAE
jgi:polyhydroxyalkanoate synthesis regulator phasin